MTEQGTFIINGSERSGFTISAFSRSLFQSKVEKNGREGFSVMILTEVHG